jgi:hypothetical protein
MQDVPVRPLSPESSLKQKTTKNITKSASEDINDPKDNQKPELSVTVPTTPIQRLISPAERLAERLTEVFLDPEIGLVFRFLYRIAKANLALNEPQELFLRLALTEAYRRAEKALHGRR